MQTHTIKLNDEDALAAAKVEWKEYCKVLKENTIDDKEYMRYYKTLKNSLYYLSKGKMILDLTESMRLAGLNEKGQPRLAIVRADAPKCYFDWNYGTARFAAKSWGNSKSELFSFDRAVFGVTNRPNTDDVSAPTPKIPARFLPKNGLWNYFILWEVDEWTLESPKDPMLLKPLTGSDNLFVVLAHWELTELERSVLRGMVR